MEEYKVGTVFELYEDDHERFIVLNTLDKEKLVYLLVAPINDKNGDITAKYDEAFVLYIDRETENIEYVEDENVVGEVIDDFFAKNSQSNT